MHDELVIRGKSVVPIINEMCSDKKPLKWTSSIRATTTLTTLIVTISQWHPKYFCKSSRLPIYRRLC